MIKKKLSKYLLFDTLVIDKNNRKKGLGSILMVLNNIIIENYNLPPFLVCEKKTINFYKQNKWKLLKNNLFSIKDENYDLKFGMMFNYIPKNNLQFWVNR